MSKSGDFLYKIIGPIILVFSIFLAWATYETQNDNQRQDDKQEIADMAFKDFAQCQAEYNDTNKKVSDIRADLARQDRENLAKRDAKIGKFVATGKGDLNAAFLEYATRQAKIEALRSSNPLPAYPDCYEKYIKTKVETPPTGGPDE